MAQMRALLTDYQGRAVFFTEEAWQHIIQPPHDYMADMPEAISATLLDPEEIRRSNTRPDTVRLYYKWFIGTLVGDKWLCVVVKFLAGEAYVLTAYATDRIKAGERFL